MAEETLQDVPNIVPEEVGMATVETLPDEPPLPPPEPEPAPIQHPQEEQIQQQEVQPEQTIHQSDTLMTEAAPSPTPQPQKQPPTMPRHSTPSQNVNGTTETSAIPTKAASHGAPARRYLNEKVTGILLEGMKKLVVQQPEDPLRVLGEYLLKRSREIEGTT